MHFLIAYKGEWGAENLSHGTKMTYEMSRDLYTAPLSYNDSFVNWPKGNYTCEND